MTLEASTPDGLVGGAGLVGNWRMNHSTWPRVSAFSGGVSRPVPGRISSMGHHARAPQGIAHHVATSGLVARERKAAVVGILPLEQRHRFPGFDRAAAGAAMGGLDGGGGHLIKLRTSLLRFVREPVQ